MERELRYAVNWRIDDDGLRFIADREAEGGAILYAYDDADPKHRPIGPGDEVRGTLTIGYGHIRTAKPGMRITEKEALELLRTDVREAESYVHRYVRAPLTQSQYNALVSIIFNVGPGRLPGTNGENDKGKSGIIVLTTGKPSSLLEKLNEGKYDVAASWFTAWKATKGFEFGLFRRRIAEMLMFMGLPWLRAYLACRSLQFTMAEAIRIAKEELEDINGTKPSTTTVIVDKPSPHPQDELVLDKPVPPPAAPPKAEAKGPEPAPGIPAPQAPVPNSNTGASPPVSPGSAAVPTAAHQPTVAAPASPLPPPKLPDPPVPIGQQTSAVDATRKADEWSKDAKSMIFSRRAWGLGLVMFGRLWMLKTGSNAVLTQVSDPLVMEMFSGFAVMLVGEIVQWWGEKKATRPLK